VLIINNLPIFLLYSSSTAPSPSLPLLPLQAELQQAKKKTIDTKKEGGKWGVTQSRAEQEAERVAAQRRQFSPELRNQVANLTNVCFFSPSFSLAPLCLFSFSL